MNNLTLDEEFENEFCDLIAGDMNRMIVADTKKKYKKYYELKTLFLSQKSNNKPLININNDIKGLVIEYLEPTIKLFDREDIKILRQEIRDKKPLSFSKEDIRRFKKSGKNVKELWLSP